ncbi:NPCBM/NEW2 domain-containing protein [Parapedobacter sp. 2B3]|uniref:NPCBM/NEW2 domain-containing protein n=1 Tax=Parapedobacter sp. 2B3 TaxID=3342381 RepID=UPI0035B6333D
MKKSIVLLVFLANLSFAWAQGDSPFSINSTDFNRWGPQLVNDDIMPTSDAVARFKDAVDALFSGRPLTNRLDVMELQLIEQGWGTMHYNQSCLGTPLKIGDKVFKKGLGTHASSRIKVTFPEPVVKFSAAVGIDNNHQTEGKLGSVQFLLRHGEQEVGRTSVLRGSDAAFDLSVGLPDGTQELTLVVDPTADGHDYDQANWCNPIAIGKSGKIYDLTATTELAVARESIPFSFEYNGKSSREFLSSWAFEKRVSHPLETVYSWTDSGTGLKVEAVVKWFESFAAADWVLNFTNTGKTNTPLIERVSVLDLSVKAGNRGSVINTLNGDECNERSWVPLSYPLGKGETRHFTPIGGRSSNHVFPFWNLQHVAANDHAPSEGVFVAVGWSGQWGADFKNEDGKAISIAAGMQTISTVLLPGESIRQPRVLIMPWHTDRLSAQVLFRRLLMFEYTPKMENKLPVQQLISNMGWGRYAERQYPDFGKFETQLAYVKKVNEVGGNAHWVDAVWFPGKFPDAVGNWNPDKARYPNGIEALSDAIHERDMKFVLWFEPERVGKNSEIATKYPQYVFGGQDGGLFKLHDRDARKFLTNYLDERIKKFGVDVYRHDFNINPLPFWQKNDAADRKGITEIRYVEGHYEMWNELRKNNPGLWIDNCASGGRRIDLETTAISVPLWRSDTNCWPADPNWDQVQTMGLAQYIPMFSAAAWEPDPYTFRSNANLGAIGEFDYLADNFDATLAKAAFDEAKVYQKFWYGDFYPLTPARLGSDNLHAWQLHRSDLGAGVIYVFRQADCPFTGFELSPRAIAPDAKYRLNLKEDYNTSKTVVLDGSELLGYIVDMPQKKSTMIVEYQKISD